MVTIRLPLWHSFRLIAGLVIVLALASNAAAAERGENATAADSAPIVLIFGDSLSAAYGMAQEKSWPALLAERLEASGYPHRVVNVSRSGETTGGGLRRLPDALERVEPTLTLLQLGGNDGLRGRPPTQIRSNLEQMLEAIEATESAVLLIGIRIPPNYGPAYTQQFEAVYRDLAEAHDVPLLPFLLEDIWNRDGMMQADGIHPSTQAQPLILELLWEEVEPLL
ncbi:arylesterase [Halorhodospira abdelmalekii]|uniref:arylesterase n=1 Tax=Halorhodospira abdelmalekii TaxID=421629 RepID=UPI001906B660|nr:arylesterase [Halorhodospira abdelmalekii]MBK1735553.1 arylesterase [Halorhodospira abdelmalekii]